MLRRLRSLPRSPWRVCGSGSAMRKFFRQPIGAVELKAFCGVRSLDDLDRPSTAAPQRAAQFGAGVTAIGEDVTQPRIQKADRGEHKRAAVAVLDVSRVHNKPDHVALRVGDDMTLAPFDLLARVEPTRTAAFRGFHRLA